MKTLSSLVIAACASTAAAQLAAYEGFADAPRPDLAGSAGGTGWSAPWNGLNSMLITSVQSTGLTYPGLATAPGSALTEPQAFYPDTASYTRSFPAIAGSNFYLSFLIRPGATYTTLGAGIRWGSYPSWILCGAPDGSQYGFHYGHYGFAYSNAPVVTGQTSLIVVHMQVGPTNTTYRMYIDPYIGFPQPGFADAEFALAGAAILPSTIELTNDGEYTTDEIRIGTTWASVLPAPCYVNCDGSTTVPILNALDFGCFLNKFAASDPYANCDGSTTPPAINALDFGCFLNRFAAGCP